MLDKKNGRILVISRYILDIKAYNQKEQRVFWEDSTLCRWLNKDFLTAAFTLKERDIIPTVKVNGSVPNNDRVFLLSADEARHYFSSDKKRATVPTAYAGTDCWWWLRSESSTRIYIVQSSGGIPSRGIHMSSGRGVRPAMWINIGS